MSPVAAAAALTAAVLMYAGGWAMAIGFLRAVERRPDSRVVVIVATIWPLLGLRVLFDLATGARR